MKAAAAAIADVVEDFEEGVARGRG